MVVPSDDPHASEYPAFCYARREFVSGFTGSAGTAAVCVGGAAALSTDGRYFLQAEMQLDGAQWQLLRAGQPGVPSVPEWLCEQLPMGAAVGIDPAVHSVEDTEALRAQLGAKGIGLVLLESNPVDTVWGAARPPPPAEPLRVHTLEHAGQSASEKLGALRGEMAAAGADLLVLSQLDEVAWALNLRGADVPHCPVGLAFAIVGADFARLYVDASKVTADVKAHLAEAGVDVHPYAQCVGQLKVLTIVHGGWWCMARVLCLFGQLQALSLGFNKALHFLDSDKPSSAGPHEAGQGGVAGPLDSQRGALRGR